MRWVNGMRRMTARVFALLALLALLPAFAQAYEFAVVRGGRLNLRAQASSASRSLGLYGTGSWVRIDGAATAGWLMVTTMDGRQGYMSSGYLDQGQNTNGATVRYANGGYVNLRSGPSMTANVIMRVTSGTTVTVESSYGEWAYIRLSAGGSSVYGYMLQSFLDSATPEAVVMTRNGGKVNVRTGPSSRYGTAGSLPSGTHVTVLLKGNGWYKITGGGLMGYMSTSYLSGSGSTVGNNTGSGGTTTSQIAWVNNPRDTQVLNLRETASQAARSIGQYRNGTQVKVVRYGASWCEVYVGTRHGYMMTKYLSFSASPYAPAATSMSYTVPTIPFVQPTPTPQANVGPAVGKQVTLVVNVGEANTIPLYRDATMQSALKTVPYGTQATMLSYGPSTCMVLLDSWEVAYVLTRYVAY